MSDHFYGVSEAGSGQVGHVAWAAYGPAQSPLAPAVLVHGLSDSSACWPGVVEHLGESRLVIVLDLRGHGNSGLPAEPFTIDGLTADVELVVRSVVDRPVVMIGHSLGALAALGFALRNPDLTAALILEDPAFRIHHGVDPAAAFSTLLADMVRHARDTSYVALMAQGAADNPGWSADEFAPWAQSKKQFDSGLTSLPHTIADVDWVESLTALAPGAEFPVRIVAGDPSRGSIVGVADGGRAAEHLGRRGRIVRLDAGHCVRRDQRAAFLGVVDEVLGEVR